MKRGLLIDRVKKELMKDAVSKEGRKFYLKTEVKVWAFLAKGDVVIKLKELWGAQEMEH